LFFIFFRALGHSSLEKAPSHFCLLSSVKKLKKGLLYQSKVHAELKKLRDEQITGLIIRARAK
jgi:hypothetical protein